MTDKKYLMGAVIIMCTKCNLPYLLPPVGEMGTFHCQKCEDVLMERDKTGNLLVNGDAYAWAGMSYHDMKCGEMFKFQGHITFEGGSQASFTVKHESGDLLAKCFEKKSEPQTNAGRCYGCRAHSRFIGSLRFH